MTRKSEEPGLLSLEFKGETFVMGAEHFARTRPCGHDDCSCSTLIDEQTITYGRGELSDFGTWSIPCRVCAQVAVDQGADPEFVWPPVDWGVKL